jgi:RNA polymerase sigma factor (sigma-70 family)
MPLGPWLYAIAHNAMINYQKKNSHYLNLLEEPEQDLREISQAHESIKGVEKQIELTVVQKQIARVFHSINPRYAEIISLKYYSELETREIAQVIDVKPTQVPVILFRALDTFRKEYKKKYPNGEIFYIP